MESKEERRTFLEWCKYVESQSLARRFVDAWLNTPAPKILQPCPEIEFIDPLTYYAESARRREQEREDVMANVRRQHEASSAIEKLCETPKERLLRMDKESMERTSCIFRDWFKKDLKNK